MVDWYGPHVPASFATSGDARDGEPSSSDAAAAANGLAGNLVSAIRSFLPGGKPPEPQLAHGKKPVKVDLLSSPPGAAHDLHADFDH